MGSINLKNGHINGLLQLHILVLYFITFIYHVIQEFIRKSNAILSIIIIMICCSHIT